MKRILFFILALSSIIACSEKKLTTATAEEIVKKALTEKPVYATVEIKTGEFNTLPNLSDEALLLYQKLEKEGYLKIQVKEENAFSKTLSVSLTDKSKDYLLKTEKEKYLPEMSKNTMIKYTYALDKLTDLEFTNNSEFFMDSKVTFIKKDPTPFYIFEKDHTPFFTQSVGFTKTDKRWVLTKEIE